MTLNAAKRGDLSLFTDAFIDTPDTEWSLSKLGQDQSKAIGSWITNEINAGHMGPDRKSRLFYVSPLRRTRQTAGFANIQDGGESPCWRLNRSTRERDYGDIGSMPRIKFLNDPIYSYSAKQFKRNPLYWRPPGGESIVDLAENRVRNFFDTLHRETIHTAVGITHGEFMQACHLTLTRVNDSEFNRWENEDYFKIANCEAFHYSRIDCSTGEEKPHICSFRRIKPVQVSGRWGTFDVSPWTEICFRSYSNEDLLAM